MTMVVVYCLMLAYLRLFTRAEIVFGHLISGAHRNAEQTVRSGILGAFKDVNERGGLHGQMLELVEFDHLPNMSNVATVEAMRAIPGMIGLIGFWDSLDGDVEASLLHNIVEHEIPIIAPVMGRAMNSASSQYIVPLRAGYDAEAWEMCRFLLEHLHLVRIALIYDEHVFGPVPKDLLGRCFQRFEVRNQTYNVAAAPLDPGSIAGGLQAFSPEAVAVFARPHIAPALIAALQRRLQPAVIYVTASSAGAALRDRSRAAGARPGNIYVTHPMPDPRGAPPTEPPEEADPHPCISNGSAPTLVAEYRRAMGPAPPDALSLEGYMGGRFAAAVLRGAPAASRAAFLGAFCPRQWFELGGLWAGPYNAQCRGVPWVSEPPGYSASRSGACSRGLREVHLLAVGADTRPRPVARAHCSDWYACAPRVDRLRVPRAYLSVPPADAMLAGRWERQFLRGLAGALPDAAPQPHTPGARLPATAAAVVGGVNVPAGDYRFPVIGNVPVPADRPPAAEHRSAVQVFPTLDQELRCVLDYMDGSTQVREGGVVEFCPPPAQEGACYGTFLGSCQVCLGRAKMHVVTRLGSPKYLWGGDSGTRATRNLLSGGGRGAFPGWWGGGGGQKMGQEANWFVFALS